LIPTFATAVNTWQCDENDHLNVQYYTEFGHEASAHLLAGLGFGRRAQRAAGHILRTTEDHIRYLREFRVPEPVEVRSVPVEVGEHELVVYHEVPAKNLRLHLSSLEKNDSDISRGSRLNFDGSDGRREKHWRAAAVQDC